MVDLFVVIIPPAGGDELQAIKKILTFPTNYFKLVLFYYLFKRIGIETWYYGTQPFGRS